MYNDRQKTIGYNKMKVKSIVMFSADLSTTGRFQPDALSIKRIDFLFLESVWLN